ncbi:MAG: MopE-related protein [Archangium sp.]
MKPNLRAPATLAALVLAVVLPACQCQRRAAIETPIAELQSCPEDERCETGLCDAEPGGEKVCLRPCTQGCRGSDVCTRLSGDRFACVPERAGLCKECEVDTDCPRVADKCITLGGAKFCGRDCSFDDTCPSTFRCVDSTSAETGASVGKQCQPVTGTCECTAATTGQQVPCEVTNSAGRCLGVKVCEPPTGFSACSAKTPAVETCNNKDDDCDGNTDEELGQLSCGVGECARSVNACVDGVTQTCVPGTPATEICNGKDDDCNGVNDDGAVVQTEICDGLDNNCNNQIDEGFDLAGDVNNCGQCGLVCSIPGNTTVNAYACVARVCSIGSCSMGRANCNQQYADGCEVDVTTDTMHCGQCNQACMTPNATPACVVGMCRVGMCNQGFANCNGQVMDGCEVDTTSSVGNCGACNAVCNAANANNSCVNSVCQFTCQANWWDADGIRSNGCEYACIRSNNGVEQCDGIDNDCDNRIDEDFDLTSNPLHCGMCNRACSAPFASTACTNSSCGITSCNAGRANCNGQYVDGCEVNTNVELNNCGGCNQQCAPQNATPRCNMGSCQIQSCNTNWANCNNQVSDGCEVNTTTSTQNCGGCGMACNLANAAPVCLNGICAIGSCLPGFYNLNNTALDGCEYACSVTNNGVEACDNVDNDCDGTIDEGFNLSNDLNNCGMCGRQCVAPNVTNAACVAGSCTVVQCAANTVNCNLQFPDGCEVNTSGDVNNCGSCGNMCAFANATPACSTSTCQIQSCNTNYRNCNNVNGDGCEVNVSNNPDACGNCTTVCPNRPNAARYCSLNACGFSCIPGFLDQDGLSANGCEYTCTMMGVDDPDDLGTDQNCDGIDGDESKAIFVALTGNDFNPGTKALPKRTVQAGVNAANSSKPHVYVSEGVYVETVALRSGISIYGGYSVSANWTRNSALYTTTIQQDLTQNGRVIAMTGSNILAPTTVAYLTVRANNASGFGASTYGIHCVACTLLTVKRVNVYAGSATSGTGGANGGAGSPAGNGAGGSNGSCDGAAGGGGLGGFSVCGRTGGNGGNGGAEGSNAGQGGGLGIISSSGGSSGNQCNASSTLCLSGGCTAGPGGGGANGSSGGAGSNGAGGNNAMLVGQFWEVSVGGDGTDGADGNGGGGGGGGGGQGGACVDDGGGNGGGGGGGGGCHGTFARGGNPGGSSFAVFLINSTGMRIESSTLTSGSAGNGGSGGTGGSGGSGGSGAGGANSCTGEVGAGGRGGDGGNGGRGGHGGGGQGGWSYAMYKFSSTPTIVSVNFFGGSAGIGGTSPGNAGANGVSGNFN